MWQGAENRCVLKQTQNPSRPTLPINIPGCKFSNQPVDHTSKTQEKDSRIPIFCVLVFRNAKQSYSSQNGPAETYGSVQGCPWVTLTLNRSCTYTTAESTNPVMRIFWLLGGALKNLCCSLRTNVYSFHRIGARYLILSILIFYLETNMWGADTMDTILMFVSWGETKLSHLNYYLKA